jgi:hypothetical protein
MKGNKMSSKLFIPPRDPELFDFESLRIAYCNSVAEEQCVDKKGNEKCKSCIFSSDNMEAFEQWVLSYNYAKSFLYNKKMKSLKRKNNMTEEQYLKKMYKKARKQIYEKENNE